MRTRLVYSIALLGLLSVVSTGCAPSASPIPSRERSVAPPTSAALAACHPEQQLDASTYLVPPALSEIGVPVAMTMTSGWKGCGMSFKELGEPAGLMMVAFWNVENVYADPCSWKGGLFDPPVGPTVDDLVKALVDQARTEASTATDVTLDGYRGKHIRLEVPTDLDNADCDKDQIAEFRFWNGPGESVWWLAAADAPGLIGEAWILDVDGTRVVIQGAYFSDAPPANQAEIAQIVQSIDFNP